VEIMKRALFVPNFGDFAEPRVFADLAAEAETAGWDGIYIWDHILVEDGRPMCDPWVAMAAAAMLTERIRLGPMVTPVPRRYPWKLSREVVSLDRLSGGRVDFGVGIGFPPEVEFGTFGHETDARIRADKLDEGLDVITGMWTGEPFSFSGDHYRVVERTFLPTPLQEPRVPIWVAATWPNKRPFRRAAKWDGVFPLLIGDGGFVQMSYDDIGEMAEYVTAHRTSDGPYEFVIGYDDAEDRSVDDLEGLGATWMFFNFYDAGAETMAKVRSGPWR
jgi:alkanesulfonate monooxygenase SsuD/methylene tetrahydromethanopterin reductase-like flavin-dependent oxidoreductase (luciferase family)